MNSTNAFTAGLTFVASAAVQKYTGRRIGYAPLARFGGRRGNTVERYEPHRRVVLRARLQGDHGDAVLPLADLGVRLLRLDDVDRIRVVLLRTVEEVGIERRSRGALRLAHDHSDRVAGLATDQAPVGDLSGEDVADLLLREPVTGFAAFTTTAVSAPVSGVSATVPVSALVSSRLT